MRKPRETAGNVREPAAVRTGELTVSLRDIQRDGSAGPVELIRHGERLGQPLQNWLQPGDEGQRCLIHFQFLVIEYAAHVDYDYDYDYENARAKTVRCAQRPAVHLVVVGVLSPGEGTGPTTDGDCRCRRRAPTRRMLDSRRQPPDALSARRGLDIAGDGVYARRR